MNEALSESVRGDGLRCFFFQAEDGIRDLTVTGVQTCALPIYASRDRRSAVRHFVAGPADGERPASGRDVVLRSEEHTSELQSQSNIVCRLLLEKKNSSVLQSVVRYFNHFILLLLGSSAHSTMS